MMADVRGRVGRAPPHEGVSCSICNPDRPGQPMPSGGARPVVLTPAAMIGGGGPGAGRRRGDRGRASSPGLTSAGVPQDQAVAAVLIERFCTAYLPPIWGWATLVWMRRSDYV